MKRMFVLYGEVVPYVYHQCDWLEVGLRDSPVLPDGTTSPLISGLTKCQLLRRKRESCRACTPIEPWLFRYTTKTPTRRVHPLPFGSRTTRRPAGAAGGPEASIVARVTIRCRAYHYAQRICTVYNFHAYTLRFRCLPRPWRARAWRARRLKKGRHWRRRRSPWGYLKFLHVTLLATVALRHTFLLRQGLAMCLGTMSAPS